MNFGELKAKLRLQIWPEGEAENLVTPHDSFFIEALYDAQKNVECYRFANTDVYPHCATYFNCGMTVLPKPNGHVTRIYVVDRLNAYGEEDSAGVDDYCDKVELQQVNYCHMERYYALCQRCSSGNTDLIESFLRRIFGVYRIKREYPEPTDEGMAGLPSLPGGYHYPQSSTDADGRSPYGVFSIHRGRIYIAPWIQSTETVVVEWDGIKRSWGDADNVDDDPKLHQFIRAHVMWQHEKLYGDPAKARDLEIELFATSQGDGKIGLLQDLIHECNEESRVRSCNEAGAPAGSSARGIGNIGGVQTDLFYNDRREYTASCPSGQSGSSVTVVKDAGTVGSALSVADANARALQMAQDEANSRLVCEEVPAVFYNTEQTYTAHCPGASDDGTPAAVGTPSTAIIEAGRYESSVSQVAADEAALAAAQAKAKAQLSCTYYNKEQTYTAKCPEDGGGGPDVEKTVGAGLYSSTISQADADAKALAAAQSEAESELECAAGFMVGNTQKSYPLRRTCNPGNGCAPKVFTFTATVPANTYVRQATLSTLAQVQLELNRQAQSLAQQQAESVYNSLCQRYGLRCGVIGTSETP